MYSPAPRVIPGSCTGFVNVKYVVFVHSCALDPAAANIAATAAQHNSVFSDRMRFLPSLMTIRRRCEPWCEHPSVTVHVMCPPAVLAGSARVCVCFVLTRQKASALYKKPRPIERAKSQQIGRTRIVSGSAEVTTRC